MSQRALLTLLATLAVLVALAIAVAVSERKPTTAAGGLLLPELKAQLNEVDRIVVRTAGDQVAATLQRQSGLWTVGERGGYPADMGRIRPLLISLAEATILEEKTSNAGSYDRLKVEDIAQPTAGGIQLELHAGESVTRLIVGGTPGGSDRRFVRRAGEPTSWLVSAGLEVPREASAWQDRRLTDIALERIRAVKIAHPLGQPLQLSRDQATTENFAVAAVPAGRELSFPGAGNAIAAALADLEMESAEPAAQFAAGDVKPIVARFETFDGLAVEISTWRLPGGERVGVRASGEEQAADEAKALNDRLERWVYVLPAWKAEQFTRRLEDLLAPAG
jgi:hypothetical protein